MKTTKKQIIDTWMMLTPRERDAWIAKEVTGVKSKKNLIACPDAIKGCAVAHYIHYPQYTTEIHVAWEVVKLLREDWLFHLIDCGLFGWRVLLLSNTEKREDIEVAWNGSEMEIICLAAIIAKLTKYIESK